MLSKNIKGLTILLFALFSLGDILSTLVMKARHPVFNEAHPLFIFGMSIWLLMLLKLAITGYLIYFFLKQYNSLPSTTARYFMVYILVLMVILNYAVFVNNCKVIDIAEEHPELIKPLPAEERLEYYQEQIGDLKIIEDATPQPKGFKIPFFFVMVVLNMAQFFVWACFEKERDYKRFNLGWHEQNKG